MISGKLCSHKHIIIFQNWTGIGPMLKAVRNRFWRPQVLCSVWLVAGKCSYIGQCISDNYHNDGGNEHPNDTCRLQSRLSIHITLCTSIVAKHQRAMPISNEKRKIYLSICQIDRPFSPLSVSVQFYVYPTRLQAMLSIFSMPASRAGSNIHGPGKYATMRQKGTGRCQHRSASGRDLALCGMFTWKFAL